MKQWEYKDLPRHRCSWDTLGLEGWELVAFTDSGEKAWFKREIVEQPKPTPDPLAQSVESEDMGYI